MILRQLNIKTTRTYFLLTITKLKSENMFQMSCKRKYLL